MAKVPFVHRSQHSRITWQRDHRYSPVQDRYGIRDPESSDFPRVTERVTQQPDPFNPPTAGDREILRVTYQGDDRCQLRCPGCYTAPRLTIPLSEVRKAGGRVRAPWDDFTGHVQALGDGLADFYLLGAEPTMDPDGSAAKLEWAAGRGLPVMACTNGAVSVDRFQQTFGAALDSGSMYKIIISLDSMVPEVNNQLRGRAWAHERTLEIIRHCVARGAPVKVQATVWGQNYPHVLESARQLFDAGVRGFAFHAGSLDGAGPDPDAEGLVTVDPLAWRALAEQLIQLRDTCREDLWHFNVPWLYFTEHELREHVIGDDSLTAAYLTHAARVEAGEPSVKPMHACPALDVPQVYLYGNGGPDWRGSLSACNLHNPAGADTFATYNPETREFDVIQDPARNQLARMAASPHLCPATATSAVRRASDRIPTEAGDLYAACRYIGSNQMPADRDQFAGYYDTAVAYYQAVNRVLASPAAGDPPAARIRRAVDGIIPLAARAAALETLAS